MGMTIREALKKANKNLAPKIDDALTKEVFKEVQDEEASTIYEVVYKVYTPHSKHVKPYQRRGEYEGLGDPYNIEIRGGKASGGVLTVINTTEPNPGGVGVDFLGEVTTYGKSLPCLVEYGSGKWGSYDFVPDPTRRYLKPRPFTAKTIEHLKESRAHITALKSGLQRQGVNVK